MQIPIADTPYWQDWHEAAPLANEKQNDVRAVALDGRGRLWCATAAGAFWRDGSTWRTPSMGWNAQGETLGSCHCLLAEPNGTLWIGTWQGLYFIEKDSYVRSEPIGLICALSQAKEGTLYAAGPTGVWVRHPGDRWSRIKGSWHQAIRAIAPMDASHVWIGTASGLYLQNTSDGKSARRFGTPEQLLSSNIYCLTTLFDGTVAIGSTGGVDFYQGTKRVRFLGVAQGLPNRHARTITADKEGRLWIATKLGVARYDTKTQKFSLRHSRRWLARDDARDVAIAPDGTAWVANAGGVDAIRRKKLTLAEKADYFLSIVRKRHIRPPGLVGPAVLKKRGDLSESFIEDDDNDGEHTGMYMAVESLRYAVTKNPEARANARAAFNAMVLLQEVTGTPHFIARSVLPAGTVPLHETDRTFTPEELAQMKRDNPREKPIEKRWVLSADGKWLWKRDASSDEIDGHLYGYAMYYDLAADESEKKRVAELVDKIVGGIVDHGFVLVDIDGKATQWGNWSPESLNGDPNWNEERFGNSTEILAHLGVAYHVTKKQKYKDAAQLLITRHGYDKNMQSLAYKTPSERTHINDELLGMVFQNLFNHLIFPQLRSAALTAIRQWHATCRRDHIPFYDFVYNQFSGRRVALEPAVETLRDWPLDMIEWTVDNRSREDIQLERTPGTDDGMLKKLVPRSEMGLVMWDQEPYKTVIGRNGEREDKPTDWLLAYWMGRYWGQIK
jgi:hypothetical protein